MPITREEFPKDKFHSWEFVEVGEEEIIARVYSSNTVLEYRAKTMADAENWVRANIVAKPPKE